jgi:hypothetical protein
MIEQDDNDLIEFVLGHAFEDLKAGSPRAIFVFSTAAKRICMAPTLIDKIREILPSHSYPKKRGNYNFVIDGTEIIFLTEMEMGNSSLYKEEENGVYYLYEGGINYENLLQN